ncbi:hypothetical protein CRENBAI_006426 [Crenichthys baileyi]|uniref:Sesquipedalian n=1 Tax=Crenichthys baileyi TaxID=28760 RepID=A0AAV9RDV0_9TELE
MRGVTSGQWSRGRLGSAWKQLPDPPAFPGEETATRSSESNVEMKLDEKVVSFFESCNSPVDKEGYLSKKGELKTSYQKRWFVLKGNLLFYKERPGEKDVIGVIVLEGCTVQLCESEEQFAFSLVWSEPGLRTYKFAAEDQASQESWIKALLSASHSYLALLVVDMEKQYGGQCVGPGASLSSNQTLQPSNISAARTISKKSPKLWPKKNSNMGWAGPIQPLLAYV